MPDGAISDKIKRIRFMKYKEESDMAKGGFPGGMGGMNMNNLMKQAQKMQKQMMESRRSCRQRHWK